MDSPWKAQLGGDGHARLDAVVTRSPGLRLPHYAGIVRSPDGTGLAVLEELAVVAELKVGSSLARRLKTKDVARDVWKLSMLLDEFELAHPGVEAPLAYACVLDNHPSEPFARAGLDAQLETMRAHPGVRILYYQAPVRASLAGPRGAGPQPRRLEPEPGRWDGVLGASST